MTRTDTARSRKRVLIYTRVSLDRTGEGLAVDRQLDRCRGHVKSREWDGWVEVGHESDNSISAYTGKVRPGWQRVLDLIEAGQVDIVLAWHLDRMTRSMLELEELILLCEKHDVTITTIEGGIDVSTNMGRMVARILAAVARAEVEMKTARQLLKFDQLAEAGLPFTGGVRAFGYELDRMTLVDWEADLIRQAAQDVLAGTSLAELARRFNKACADEGTPRNWTSTGVRQLLENPRYAAIRMARGERIGPAAWPAVFDEDTHLALVNLFHSRVHERSRTGNKPGTLLTGLGFCGTCGEVLGTSGKVKAGYYPYVCRENRHLAVPRDRVDQVVVAEVLTLLSQPGIASWFTPSSDGAGLEDARAELVVVRERLDSLGEDYADGLIDRATLKAATERLRARQEAAETTLALGAAGTVLDGMDLSTLDLIVEGWNGLPLERQRAIVEALVEVTVEPTGPGRRYRDEQVEVRSLVGS